jgi:hypothetical protein
MLTKLMHHLWRLQDSAKTTEESMTSVKLSNIFRFHLQSLTAI